MPIVSNIIIYHITKCIAQMLKSMECKKKTAVQQSNQVVHNWIQMVQLPLSYYPRNSVGDLSFRRDGKENLCQKTLMEALTINIVLQLMDGIKISKTFIPTRYGLKILLPIYYSQNQVGLALSDRKKMILISCHQTSLVGLSH